MACKCPGWLREAVQTVVAKRVIIADLTVVWCILSSEGWVSRLVSSCVAWWQEKGCHAKIGRLRVSRSSWNVSTTRAAAGAVAA